MFVQSPLTHSGSFHPPNQLFNSENLKCVAYSKHRAVLYHYSWDTVPQRCQRGKVLKLGIVYIKAQFQPLKIYILERENSQRHIPRKQRRKGTHILWDQRSDNEYSLTTKMEIVGWNEEGRKQKVKKVVVKQEKIEEWLLAERLWDKRSQ